MKIGISTRTIGRKRGALNVYWSNLCENLKEVNERHELVGIDYKEKGVFDKEVVLPPEPLGSLVLNKHDFDLIHCRGLNPFRLLTRTKKVVTLHAVTNFECEEEALTLSNLPKFLSHKKSPMILVDILKHLLSPFTVKHIDGLITVSENSKALINKHLGVPLEEITVIHHGVSEDFKASYNSGYIKEKYDINERYIFHVSTYRPAKNPDNLLEGFRKAQRELENIKLVIAGKGWPNFESNDKVKILGWVPKKDLIALYNEASLFLFPSLYESFGLPLIEAMACGCPIITSNRYSMPEVAGDAALFVDPREPEDITEKILYLFKKNGLRENLIEKGLERAKKFSWRENAKEVLKLYEEIGPK